MQKQTGSIQPKKKFKKKNNTIIELSTNSRECKTKSMKSQFQGFYCKTMDLRETKSTCYPKNIYTQTLYLDTDLTEKMFHSRIG